MNNKRVVEASILGAFLFAGLILLGYVVSNGALRVKSLDRTVTVKGLAEREMPADIAIWPIRFSEADNDLNNLYSVLQQKTDVITDFLKANGFSDAEISTPPPAIVDRQTQGYGDANRYKFRYSANTVVSVYSTNVDAVRSAMKRLVDLGKHGIVIAGQDYQTRTQFLFRGLNEIKPEMVEEATRNAREVAEKFAKDSDSTLGKIKRAWQGQFSINDRDSNTPHIKKVRVVSTLEYYLTD